MHRPTTRGTPLRLLPALLRTCALVGIIGCTEEERVCQTYGYDLYNTTGLALRIELVEPTPGFIGTEIRELPVEFHTEFLCDQPDPDPMALPALQAEWIGHDERYLLELSEGDWSSLRQDPIRGYPYYRAVISEETLVPLL